MLEHAAPALNKLQECYDIVSLKSTILLSDYRISMDQLKCSSSFEFRLSLTITLFRVQYIFRCSDGTRMELISYPCAQLNVVKCFVPARLSSLT